VLVLKINYTKHLDRARKSVRYHAFRTREVPEDRKGMFDRDSDSADVGAFIKSLDDPLTQERQTRRGPIGYAVMHRLMLSVSRQEFEACGLTSWKPVVREALAAFERYHGIRLEWVAAEHLSKSHPHVHIDIKSVHMAADGSRSRLVITQEFRQHLRWAVEGILKRERARVFAERQQERAQQRNMERFWDSMAHALTRGLTRSLRDDGAEPDPLRARKPKRPQQERPKDDRERER